MSYDSQHSKEVNDYRLCKLRRAIDDAVSNLTFGTPPEQVAQALTAAIEGDDRISAENTNTIELREEGGGWRDYLEGKAIHSGAFLEILVNDRWWSVRYEVTNYERRWAEAHGGGRAYIIDRRNRPTLCFRWPSYAEQ